MKTRSKPKVLSVCITACSKLFIIESVRLLFVNGSEAEYERVSSSHRHGAVIIVPMLDSQTCLLVSEYVVGLDRYEFGLPKGLVQEGETTLEAANRELMEELGYRANRLVKLNTLSLAAGFMCYETDVILAMDLVPSSRTGDEPESLEIHPCSLLGFETLVSKGQVSDARSIAALYVAKSFINSRVASATDRHRVASIESNTVT